MVVPDFELICEIMLVAEGFQDARLLARKFITLYTLCRELLSKQDHYDWGLRAIKSVLVVAGSLKVIMSKLFVDASNSFSNGFAPIAYLTGLCIFLGQIIWDATCSFISLDEYSCLSRYFQKLSYEQVANKINRKPDSKKGYRDTFIITKSVS